LTSGFQPKFCVFLISSMHSTHPTHRILLNLITIITFGEAHKLWSSSLWKFFLSPVISPLLGPNILVRTLFSNTLNLCSSLNVTDQVLHAHGTTNKSYISVYVPKYLNFATYSKDWLTTFISRFCPVACDEKAAYTRVSQMKTVKMR
jgi:hypothetical protein